ncbi:hypothetical protein VTK73DRAFT_6755 [Phialemonium thermophilum]|uniref:DNA mismatch repair proteins mutS family domain-containing protein n=1 Tax=Phialemonium thermophilum TaxID=223376 RepID=A0ABR3WHS5_9PEZI
MEGNDSGHLGETIMAVSLRDRGTLGCAYYVAADEALFLHEDTAMAGMELVETLLLQAQPTTVIVTNREPESLMDYLESGSPGESGYPADATGRSLLRIVGPSEFNYDAARDRLLHLDLELCVPLSTVVGSATKDDLGTDTEGGVHGCVQSRMLRLAARIDLDSRLSIGCAGAVLNELQRRAATQDLPGESDAPLDFRVRKMDMISWSDALFIHADTLAALQVLATEPHRKSRTRGPDGPKPGAQENLSVFGLFQRLARTPQGKMRLRKMCLRPSIDMDVIRERHRTIAVLLRPENAHALASMTKLLRGVQNLKTPLRHLRQGVDLPSRIRSVRKGVWMALSRFAQVSMEISEVVRSVAAGQRLMIVSKWARAVDLRAMVKVGERIHAVVDFEQSEDGNRTAVRRGVSAELDELKQRYDGLDEFLSHAARRLAQAIPEWAGEHVQNCCFYPQIGFLTVVRLDPETGRGHYEGEGLLDDDWQSMFVDEGCVYYKNRRMRDLDEQIGDIYCMIVDKEIEMVHELAVNVLQHEDALVAASDFWGELDSLVALAQAAELYHWAAPQMSRQNVVQIRGGRHPLQELVVSCFIPNDCVLSGGEGQEEGNRSDAGSARDEDGREGPSMLVLTGANHSGKSVYLKQMALIVYMAHVGSYVPADSAVIGLTDRILTRMATRESLARDESAFAIDLRQAASSINLATRRSLVLIDEFGKGTNAHDGAGLMTALLDHFLHLGAEQPKVLAATHFHEIFENEFLAESRRLRFAHMEVAVDLDEPDPEGQVTYRFRLAPGRSTSSFGSICAAVHGVDAAVVDRAEALALLLARKEDLQEACAKLSAEEEVKLEKAEWVARQFLELDIPLDDGEAADGGARIRSALREAFSPQSRADSSGWE